MEFSWQHLKGLLSYGWKLLASSLSSVIYNNLRSLIIGKMYTSADLAYYNQGDNLTYNIASSVVLPLRAFCSRSCPHCRMTVHRSRT